MIWRGWHQIAPLVPISSGTMAVSLALIAVAGGALVAFNTMRKQGTSN